jgi:dipeptidyl aminopeptidase/acylaminoacyl peptidase
VRTPIEQTNAIVRALRSAGNPPRHLIIKPGEGHGYGKLENNVDLYNKVFEFLDETIGAKSKR